MHNKWYQSLGWQNIFEPWWAKIFGVEMSPQDLRVEKFDGRNGFSIWQTRVKAELKRARVWRVLKGEKPKSITAEAWEDDSDIALGIIHSTLSDEVINNVEGIEDPRKLWEKLQELYMGRTTANRIIQKKRFYGTRLKE